MWLEATKIWCSLIGEYACGFLPCSLHASALQHQVVWAKIPANPPISTTKWLLDFPLGEVPILRELVPGREAHFVQRQFRRQHYSPELWNQNPWGWEGPSSPLGLESPTPSAWLEQGQVEEVAQEHVQLGFDYFQRWRLQNKAGQIGHVWQVPQLKKHNSTFLSVQMEFHVF